MHAIELCGLLVFFLPIQLPCYYIVTVFKVTYLMLTKKLKFIVLEEVYLNFVFVFNQKKKNLSFIKHNICFYSLKKLVGMINRC